MSSCFYDSSAGAVRRYVIKRRSGLAIPTPLAFRSQIRNPQFAIRNSLVAPHPGNACRYMNQSGHQLFNPDAARSPSQIRNSQFEILPCCHSSPSRARSSRALSYQRSAVTSIPHSAACPAPFPRFPVSLFSALGSRISPLPPRGGGPGWGGRGVSPQCSPTIDHR